jgi:hypothetical protein
MDLGTIQENIPFIIGALALIALQLFLRKKAGPAANQQQVVQGLLAEIQLDQSIAEHFSYGNQAKKYTTTTWKMNKDRLDFLEKDLQANLNNAFMMAEDYNKQIDAAKRFKSTSYIVGIDSKKLMSLFNNSRQGLEKWLIAKTGTKNPVEKVPGLMDDLLGKR